MVDFRIRGKAGVMGEIRTVVHKKTEVEVIPGVNFGVDPSFFFVDNATQVKPPICKLLSNCVDFFFTMPRSKRGSSAQQKRTLS